jgi:hypothetical protein
MKVILLAAVLITSFGVSGFSQQKKLQDLVGRWEILGENTGACLEVIDSSTVVLIYNGEKRKIIDYKIDFSKAPIWFDFSTGDSSSIVAVKSLLEIVNDNMIKWQLFMDEDRTTHFSSSRGELFYLRKASAGTNTGVVASH